MNIFRINVISNCLCFSSISFAQFSMSYLFNACNGSDCDPAGVLSSTCGLSEASLKSGLIFGHDISELSCDLQQLGIGNSSTNVVANV